MTIERYISAQRSREAKRYATEYAVYVREGEVGDCPPHTLHYMRAQGIRLTIDKLAHEESANRRSHASACPVTTGESRIDGAHCTCIEDADAWREYDAAASELARNGMTGAIGDPLPNLMSSRAVSFINDDPEAFQVRVRGFAYAQHMENIHQRMSTAKRAVSL